MFGIDLGLTVSSITLTTPKNKIIDNFIIFGDTKNKDYWERITDMAEHLTESVINMIKGNPNILIDPLVAIETPIFPWRTRNPQEYANTQALYAVLRYKLETRGFKVYDIHPLSAKAVAKKYFKKPPKSKYLKRGSLTKEGMIRAFFKIHGRVPDYSTKVGRETLADSFFIAKAGIEKRKVSMSA